MPPLARLRLAPALTAQRRSSCRPPPRPLLVVACSSSASAAVSSSALALALCNVNRVCMSVAILPIAAQLGWDPATQGLVQSSFLWGYTASQAQGGALADRLGGRAVVAAAIAVFSLCTLLTPLALLAPPPAAALPLLLLARAAVGLGQGVVLPSATQLLAAHVPPAQRARSVGLAFAGFHGGTILGLLLSPVLLQRFAWPTLFAAVGLLGLPVLFAWLRLAPPPAAARAAAAAPPPPLSTYLASRSVWAILVANSVNHCCYFIFLFMMPTYFHKVWALDIRASALYSLLPWVAMGGMSYAAGAAADALLPRLGATRVRKAAQALSFLGPAALLACLLRCASPQAALGCLTAALGLASFGQAGFVSNIQDVGGRHAGRLFGLANTAGCLAGIAGTAAAGLVLQHGSWADLFRLQGALYVAGAAFYSLCAGTAAVE